MAKAAGGDSMQIEERRSSMQIRGRGILCKQGEGEFYANQERGYMQIRGGAFYANQGRRSSMQIREGGILCKSGEGNSMQIKGRRILSKSGEEEGFYVNHREENSMQIRVCRKTHSRKCQVHF